MRVSSARPSGRSPDTTSRKLDISTVSNPFCPAVVGCPTIARLDIRAKFNPLQLIYHLAGQLAKGGVLQDVEYDGRRRTAPLQPRYRYPLHRLPPGW